MADVKDDIPYILVGTHFYDGIPFPGSMPESNLRRIPETPVYQDDVYVIGYPKSGSIWTMTAVEAILKSDNLDDFIKNGIESNRLPLERPDGYEKHITWKQPRIIHTHVKYHMLPKETLQGKAKVIHIIRNPRDVAVSYFHFTQINKIDFGYYAGSWAAFFDSFMAGHVGGGSWSDYNIDWLKHRGTPNILFIKYEDFHRHPEEMIGNIATFLGKSVESDKIKQIVDIISFKSMKSNPGLDVKHEKMKSAFLRKGVVGDWKNYFTEEQENRADEMYQQFKVETGVELRLT